jgi:PAS domain S-box-containing protein
MPGARLHKFFLSIVFPSILAIALYVLAIFFVVVPAFEDNIMERKKEMISELTNTAWSLLEEFDEEYKSNKLTKEEAQKLAASRIRQIRYGRENKDYFWITDMQPVMIMHPYTSELIDADLSEYQDANGKKLFVESAELVRSEGDGFIEYMWQWKDDPTRIVPKLSYVRGFEPWGWIVGTGIYLEDVREEMTILKNRLLRISLFITLLIAAILSFVIRQSLNIENKRKDAEGKLQLSKQKYKSLVEASTEGTLMILNQSIIFSNAMFNKLIGYDATTAKHFEDIFKLSLSQMISTIDDPKKSASMETQIVCDDKSEKEVVLSVSEIKYGENKGYIIVTKEISQRNQIEKQTEQLSQELQTSLLLMNQPIRHLVRDVLKCSDESTIKQAASLMAAKNRNAIFVHREGTLIGVINNSDFLKRVIAANLDTSQLAVTIMTSPVISIDENALLYEALLLLNDRDISHIAVKNQDGEMIGVVSKEDIAAMQQNSVSHLIREIGATQDIDHILKIHNRVPVLVNALIESGDNTQNITRIITSVSDAIANRILTMAVESLGEPPCQFAFMVMGSEGRMEQTLRTDQDNAIIFEDVSEEQSELVFDYFLKLGQKVSHELNAVGYTFCDGEMMASNPKWTQPLSVWKDYFTEWITQSDPQSVLDASIFFDFREVFGSTALVAGLREHVNNTVEGKSVFFYHLAQSITKYKAPLSLFGKIIDKNHSSDQISLDIKKVLLPIMSFGRLYALFHQQDETNTLARIKQLYQLQVIPKSMHDELVLSYNYLMQIRFRWQARSILSGKPPSNVIDINQLTHIEVSTIKKIFAEISNLQTKLNFDFKGTM